MWETRTILGGVRSDLILVLEHFSLRFSLAPQDDQHCPPHHSQLSLEPPPFRKMRFLSVLRFITLGGAVLLSLVNLGTSAFENSRTTPRFHYTMFLFPFALSIITVVIIPTIMIIERRTRDKHGRLSMLSSVIFELPLLVLFLLLWFVCAHTGIVEFFGPFRHCNRGQGVGVVAAGLDVPSHCKTVAVVHGVSWLTCFAFLIISAFAGLFSLLALVRQGSNVFHLRLTELTITGRPSVGARNEKQV
ncbi:hypothetical protein CVT26_002604 [Gymnopilus dilepis]|uniref:Uncharacterized protein n=1 Tax=Gymnopilus dilepis TaxID=231916 RepID=A0A409VF57_9AGAR|nr:hypothetical protein CVT26_002604 [Gymnopilus dilepis]